MKNPLADKIRPECLDDIVGQKHLLGKGKALRNIRGHCPCRTLRLRQKYAGIVHSKKNEKNPA